MTNARQSRSAREKSAAMQAEAAQTAARRRVLGVAGAVIAAIVVLVGATVVVRTAQQNADKDIAVATPANVSGGAFVDGKDAPVALKIYEDFHCPVCARFEQENRDQIAAWVSAGTVQVEYKPIAILDRMSTDGYSTRAANAAAVVADTSAGSWVAFHNLLFDNQPAEGGAGLTDDKLIELAVQAGATQSAVRPGIESKTFAGWVTKMTADATSGPDKVTGTPTVFVNGERLQDWSAAGVKTAVEAAANK